MTYVYWLAILSAVFIILERLRPRNNQGWIREGLATDFFYLIFNGHFLGVLLAAAARPMIVHLYVGLESIGLQPSIYVGVVNNLSLWTQFLIALICIDFLHWCIHILMHKVPVFWEFHKVHHSIQKMDWMGSMRFHWGEVVIYKTLSYPLLALLGFDNEVLFALAVVTTAVGHFNHSNLRISIGPLKYLLNSPEMHVWHHAHNDEQPIVQNFGITLSVWDWLFGTAQMDSDPPTRLGFQGIVKFPTTAPGQILYPLPVERIIRKMTEPKTDFHSDSSTENK